MSWSGDVGQMGRGRNEKEDKGIKDLRSDRSNK